MTCVDSLIDKDMYIEPDTLDIRDERPATDLMRASMKFHLSYPNFILLIITIFSTPVAMDELYDIIRDVSQDLLTNHTSFETADCQDAFDNGKRNSGAAYTLYTDPESAHVLAVCQFDDQSGWTLIQRRLDGTIDFNRGWDEYARGFGNIPGEYRIGLENIHHLTKKNQKLSIFLEDHEGQSRTANYSLFQIDNEESNYQLLVSGYSRDAEDSLFYHHELGFSTFDYDNDGSPGSCALTYQGDHNKIIHSTIDLPNLRQSGWPSNVACLSMLAGPSMLTTISMLTGLLMLASRSMMQGFCGTEKSSTCNAAPSPRVYQDCQDVFDNGERNSGAAYTLHTDPDSAPVLAVCQFDDQSGWTLIQRRLDGTIDFNRGWDEYARGFGNIQGEYWIGLKNIHHLTKKNQKLSIFLEDHEGQSRTANYSLFQIENKESNYQLLFIFAGLYTLQNTNKNT
ncbi:uncharacterized protein [Watersipora subatra]|uniref:uncharacterized protein n=1 Tax=Watersipora subatra TaxID=2589382 RepID=UPI00355C6DFF